MTMSATPAAAASNEIGGDDLRLVLPGRTLPAAAGWEWIAGGWRLFAKAPLMWILALVIVFILAVLLNFIPFIGSLAFQLLQGVIAAGFVVACRSLEKGGDFELEHLFAGFKRNFGNLMIVGLLLLLGWMAILLVCAGIVGFSVLGAVMTGNNEDMAALMLASWVSTLLALLVAALLMLPLLAAYWFAPPLVVMHGVAPVAAMKASLAACFRNWIPFLVYSIVMTGFVLLALIPFGLGMIVWIPVAITSTYVAYRRIFTEEASAAVTAV
jgi:uncharacterized membrane protein